MLIWFFNIATGFPSESKMKKFKVTIARFGPVLFQLPYSGDIGGGGSRSPEPVARATPPLVKDIRAVNVLPPWLIRSIERIHDPSIADSEPWCSDSSDCVAPAEFELIIPAQGRRMYRQDGLPGI